MRVWLPRHASTRRTESSERVSWRRVLWVAPLTVVVSALVCVGLRTLLQAVDPSLEGMGQLGPPMLTLAIEGSIAAVLVFIVFALVLRRPLFWYRIVGVVALVLSCLPDLALGLGGAPMQLALRYVSPLTSVGARPGGRAARAGAAGFGPGGPPPGAGSGGPPPGFLNAAPIEQVLVLILLHTAVAAVCIIMLTTLTRERASR